MVKKEFLKVFLGENLHFLAVPQVDLEVIRAS